MYGRGRGYQLLNNATSGEVNNSIRNEEEVTSETVSEIITIPASVWQRELSPPRPVSETVQRLTEWSFQRMKEEMEEQRNARRHQINIRTPLINYGPPATRRLPDFLQEHQQVQRKLMELTDKFLETQARLMPNGRIPARPPSHSTAFQLKYYNNNNQLL
ncbi:hypothetical protein DAPPUDRAFT_108405 [Daphnia pulex]|uniref:Uncharacterized protein n=1 Tax=Daphnia pulex TaxID=6669 RepID=E9H038_DAPPU|nr:hypothetical protein DAPPUDRAFT_108405 [Daphnia pulex]|eukprot:EFX74948.1 hypothetical protein DAPPUDRAFT_108405 [Daphnia pulex]